MVLIFGGAYQGKLDYARERFCPGDAEVYNCDNNITETPSGRTIISGFEKWIYALVLSKTDTQQAVRQFIDSNPDCVVICCDISCGVVPIEPELRAWREAVGRALAELSRQSDEVIRIFCGIPTKLK